MTSSKVRGFYSTISGRIIKRIILAFALLLAPAAAFAVNTPPLNLSQLPGGGPACAARGITVPPPQFDHPAKNEQIVRAPCEVVKTICKTDGAVACAILPGNGFKSCQIVIPTEMGNSGWEYEYTLRHERGHCNSNSTGHDGYYLPSGL